MGIGVSLFLLATGAILTFAVETEAEGVNINTIGIILMIVGAIGILLSLLVFGDRGATRSDERTVIRDREI
jgi:hypothetical protein